MPPLDLAQAFERAARVRGPDDPALADPRVRRARQILDARLATREAERCPVSTLRRVEGAFGARTPRTRSVAARLLDLVFDSGISPLPAMRGAACAPRTLRYAGGGATVDLQVRAKRAESSVLHVAVSPAFPGGTVEVHALPRGAARRTLLDGAGTGEIPLPARVRRISVAFRFVGAPPFRIASLTLV